MVGVLAVVLAPQGAPRIAALAALVTTGVVSWYWSRRVLAPLEGLVATARELEDPAPPAPGARSTISPPEDPQLATLHRVLHVLAARVAEQAAAVRAERNDLDAIVQSMSDGVLVTDPDGRAQRVNPAFYELFGLAGDPIGRKPLELVRQPGLAELVAATLRQGRPGALELELRTPERRTLALSAAPLRPTADSGPAGAVVVARDTTQATRLAEMRRDFVANASHELKSPLAAIRGYAETLQDGALSEPATAARFVERILAQSRRLQALLEDLLTLSRLEGLDDSRAPDLVDLAEVVDDARQVVEGSARAKQVDLRVDAAPVPRVPGHRGQLERLVTNLLDNAVKYNRPGGRVVVTLRRRGGHVELAVQDTGGGIPTEALPRVFERFYRVDRGRSRDEGGTGLGLAIVKHIALTHGGTVDVESTLGEGTTFRVGLPTG